MNYKYIHVTTEVPLIYSIRNLDKELLSKNNTVLYWHKSLKELDTLLWLLDQKWTLDKTITTVLKQLELELSKKEETFDNIDFDVTYSFSDEEIRENTALFLKEKANSKTYLVHKNEIEDYIFNYLLEKNLLLPLYKKSSLYLIVSPLDLPNLPDVVLNTYNEWLVSKYLEYNNFIFSDLDSTKLLFKSTSKFRNLFVFSNKVTNVQTLELIKWLISVEITPLPKLETEIQTTILNWFKFSHLSLTDILIRLTDKRSKIYNNSEILQLITSWLKKYPEVILNEYVSDKVKSFYWNRIVTFFSGTIVEQEITDKYTPKNDSINLESIFSVYKTSPLQTSLQESNNNSLISYLDLTESEKQDVSLYKYYNIFDSVFEILDEFKDLDNKKILNKDYLIAEALRIKKEDAYHSTTIEGYKISQNEMDYLLGYNLKPNEFNNKNFEELEKIIVIQGYTKAFEWVLNNAKDYITSEDIKTINQKIWSIAYELRWLSDFEQRLYRREDKQMRGSVWYSMPHWVDIPTLVEILCRNLNKIENKYLKAIVAHFLLVPIQPFNDGNGRTSRLLMNFILLANNYSWKTVTDKNYRLKYLSQWRNRGDNELENRSVIQETFRDFVKHIHNI